MPFLVIRILKYKHNENTSYSFVLLSKIKKKDCTHTRIQSLFSSIRAESGTRTRDLLITNELLYQLSYFGKQLPFESACKSNAFL